MSHTDTHPTTHPDPAMQETDAVLAEDHPLTDLAARQLTEQTVPGWRQDAMCASVDPDAWFPEKGAAVDAPVLRLCADCPVRRSCLATALLGHDLGVWAGTTELTRRQGHRMLRDEVPAAEALDILLDLATRKAHRVRRRGGNQWSGREREQTRRDAERAA